MYVTFTSIDNNRCSFCLSVDVVGFRVIPARMIEVASSIRATYSTLGSPLPYQDGRQDSNLLLVSYAIELYQLPFCQSHNIPSGSDRDCDRMSISVIEYPTLHMSPMYGLTCPCHGPAGTAPAFPLATLSFFRSYLRSRCQ